MISFTGKRYQVKLPWNEGHNPLPSNQNVSVKRLKRQLTKLRQDPYDKIIKEQLESGIIEKVVELEKPGKVDYLPHHVVVRKEAKTTKVRVVCDASYKESKNSVSFKDCLHVCPSLTHFLFDIFFTFRRSVLRLLRISKRLF